MRGLRPTVASASIYHFTMSHHHSDYTKTVTVSNETPLPDVLDQKEGETGNVRTGTHEPELLVDRGETRNGILWERGRRKPTVLTHNVPTPAWLIPPNTLMMLQMTYAVCRLCIVHAMGHHDNL